MPGNYVVPMEYCIRYPGIHTIALPFFHPNKVTSHILSVGKSDLSTYSAT